MTDKSYGFAFLVSLVLSAIIVVGALAVTKSNLQARLENAPSQTG